MTAIAVMPFWHSNSICSRDQKHDPTTMHHPLLYDIEYIRYSSVFIYIRYKYPITDVNIHETSPAVQYRDRPTVAYADTVLASCNSIVSVSIGELAAIRASRVFW